MQVPVTENARQYLLVTVSKLQAEEANEVKEASIKREVSGEVSKVSISSVTETLQAQKGSLQQFGNNPKHFYLKTQKTVGEITERLYSEYQGHRGVTVRGRGEKCKYRCKI